MARFKQKENHDTGFSSYDPKNPYTKTIEDEGEFVIIHHESLFITNDTEDIEEEEDGSTENRSSLSK